MLSMSSVRLSSSYVAQLSLSMKGAALTTSSVQLDHSTRDNREKFTSSTDGVVKVEDSQDARIAQEITRMKNWEQSVISHENTHMQVGGEFAGAPSYIYQKGPDGKLHIVGGEVTMRLPAGGDLEKLKAALERVKRAAMAPADPSPQDHKTAAMAAAQQSAVENAIKRKKAVEAYEKQKDPTMQRYALPADELKHEVEPFRKLIFKEMSKFEMFA